MKFVLSLSLILLSLCVSHAQNYDMSRETIERNPSYKLEEYFEIVLNEHNQPDMVHVVKNMLNGSAIETKTYYSGTPYYKDAEWHKATVKMPGQIPIEGWISFNQVYQRVYFRARANTPMRQFIEPEYFKIEDETFSAFPENDLLSIGYFTKVDYPHTVLLHRREKLQRNTVSQEIQGYEVGQSKYEAFFVDHPVYFINEKGKTLKVENKAYFYKQFVKDKKETKAFVKAEKINFNKEEDVKKLLDYLLL